MNLEIIEVGYTVHRTTRTGYWPGCIDRHVHQMLDDSFEARFCAGYYDREYNVPWFDLHGTIHSRGEALGCIGRTEVKLYLYSGVRIWNMIKFP